MNTFSISEALHFGWDTFKKDPWFYVGVTFTLSIFSFIVQALTSNGHGLFWVVGFLISLAASTVVTIAYAQLALSATNGPHAGWNDLWAPKYFLDMFGSTILQSVIILVGFVLLILPGILAMLFLCFTQLAVVDKGLKPVGALKESFRLSKPHIFQLFLFMVTLVLINIVGLLCIVVGLLVSIPVSLLAVAHVYRKLVALQGVPMVTPTPPAA